MPTTTALAAADLRARREATQLSRQELAHEADCSLSWLADLERGLIPKRSRTLKRVLAALDRIERARSTAASKSSTEDVEPAGNGLKAKSADAGDGHHGP